MGLLAQRVQAEQPGGGRYAAQRVVVRDGGLHQGVERLGDQMEIAFLFAAQPVIERLGVVGVEALHEVAAVEAGGLA